MTRHIPAVWFLIGFGCTRAPESEVEMVFPQSLLSVLDTNGDLRIDREEFESTAAKGASFGEYDRDSDGHIDASELMRSLLSKSPSPGKIRRHQDSKGNQSWSAWKMHAERNGLSWGTD